MNGPENDLSNTLSRKADEFARRGGAGLDLAQVVSRAGEIRRGRRMRASMAMAAVVLAVAVPVGITVISNDPTTTEKPSPAAPVDTSALTTAGLRTGEPPASGYAWAGRLQPGNYAAPLADGEEIGDLARVGDDFMIGVRDDSGDLVARYVTLDGVVGVERPANYGFGVSADGRIGAIVQPDGTVVAYQQRGAQQVVVGRVDQGSGFTVIAVQGTTCARGGDCTVYLSSKGEDPKVWMVSPGTEPSWVHSGLLGASDVTQAGEVAGPISITADGSCSEVRSSTEPGPQNNPALGRMALFQTCDYSLVMFSPDDRHLLARGPYQSGMGDGQLAVLDARTGRVLLDLRTVQDATITSVTWEDDAHLLATITENGTWALVRIALDGEREFALPPVAASDDLRPPFFIAGQR